VETFSALTTFNAQELANSAFALATWRAAPSDVWLAHWCQVMRQRWGKRGACPPGALVRAAYALAAMPPPAPVPVTQMIADQQRQQRQQRQLAAADDGSAAATTSTSGMAPPPPPPPSEPLPSFNWMCGFLGAARAALDALSAGELATLMWALARLGRAPDLVFADAWYRAAAARMASFGPGEIALSLHALGALRPGVGVPGGVPGRFVQELLPAARRALGAAGGAQLSQMLWGLAELRLWPGRAWVEDWLAGEVGWVVGSSGAYVLLCQPTTDPPKHTCPTTKTAVEPQLPTMDGPSLSDAAWALARLEVGEVPGAWLAALVAAVDGLLEQDERDEGRGGGGGGLTGSSDAAEEQQQHQQVVGPGSAESDGTAALHLGGSALVDRAAAQARGYATAAGTSGDGAAALPPPPLPAEGRQGRRVDARGLAVLIWSLARLGHRPPRGWLLAFKAASGRELGEEPARRLARFIAGALLVDQRGGGGGGGGGRSGGG
jgi:hypothetical protein